MSPTGADRTPDAAPLLELRHVDAGYGPFHALFDVSLVVGPGSVTALLGTNGAGKTTLARVVTGLVRPTAGEVWFDGHKVGWGRPPPERNLGVRLLRATRLAARFSPRFRPAAKPPAPFRIARLGVVHAPEGRSVFASLSVRENLELSSDVSWVRVASPAHWIGRTSCSPDWATEASRSRGPCRAASSGCCRWRG